MIIVASAPAKIILVGEHAIMYGGTAIVMAIDQRLTVTVDSVEQSPEEQSEAKDCQAEQAQAHLMTPGEFKLRHPQLKPTEAMVAYLADYFGRQVRGLKIESDIPQGAGLGSSAALSVASSAALLGRIDHDTLAQAAWLGDHFFHGAPSGLDTDGSLYGGLRVKRGNKKSELLSLQIEETILIVDSGIPHSTVAVNQAIRDKWANDQARLSNLIAQLSDLAESFMAQTISLPFMFYRAQELLCELGVSSAKIDEFVGLLRERGIAAKITGAGLGGCLLVLCDNLALIKGIAVGCFGEQVQVFKAIPDQEGVRIE